MHLRLVPSSDQDLAGHVRKGDAWIGRGLESLLGAVTFGRPQCPGEYQYEHS